jgi:excinuclease ABC subunit C
VAGRSFDRKFGAGFLAGLPAAPAVYLFRDEEEQVLYVGKAKDVRRRLSGYRNASRRKAHRKMRTLVREASSIEVRLQESERAALLTENALIRELRPPYNVDGAYSFLYPAIGLREEEKRVLLCFTTSVEAWEGLDFRWYGSFRSRLRAKDAFDALADLLSRLGHLEPRTRLRELPRIRGSRVVGVRRLGGLPVASVRRFLAGESMDGLGELALALLEKPRARRDAAEVQEGLARLAAFYRRDVVRLRAALDRVGRSSGFVSQDERDALFLESRTR